MSEHARKLRGFVLDQENGRPLSNVVLLLEGKSTDNGQTTSYPLGVLLTDSAGFASFDLSPYPENSLPNTAQVTPVGDEGSQLTLDLALLKQPDRKVHFVVKVDPKHVGPNGYVGLASVQNPDEIDREVSPHSFAVRSDLVLGEGACQTPVPPPFATRDLQFGRIVFTSNQSQPDDLLSVDALDPAGDLAQRASARAEIRFADILLFRQRWYALGHALGQISYSLPLAPCESVNLAVIDWSRQDTIMRQDSVTSREKLYHDQRRDRAIDETIGAALHESQTGFSLMGGSSGALAGGSSQAGQGSGSATVPVYGIPVDLTAAASAVSSVAGSLLLSFGGAVAHTSGGRDLTAESQQELHDRVRQATSVVRSLNSTVIIQATQQEENVVQTRTVTNHNHCHALTVQYYEVLRSFKLVTEFKQRRRAVLIPFRILSFDAKTALRFRRILEGVLFDPSLRECFAALARLEYCPDSYDDDAEDAADEQPGGAAGSKPKISRYTLALETGEHQASITGVGDGGTLGGIWIKLRTKTGDWKEVLFKAVREHPATGRTSATGSEGIPGYELKKGTTRTIDVVTGDAIGLDPADVDRVRVEWVESHGDDSWAFKGLSLRYQLEGPGNRTGALLINGQQTYSGNPYITFFDDSGSSHLSWEGAVSAESDFSDEDMDTEGGPHPEAEEKVTQEGDECCAKQLIGHLNANLGYYNRAIWLLQDPTERRILLDKILAAVGIADLVDDIPLAVSGDYVAFPFADSRLTNVLLEPAVQEALSGLGLGQQVLNDIWNRATERGPREPKKPQPSVSYVTLPTRGLFAEAQLGHCNSCEVRDITRFWKWDESPCERPPSIEGIRPGPQGQTPTVTPSTLPAPVVSIQQPPAAPDPVGLAVALRVLGTPNLFRDMSGLPELRQLLTGLSSGAVDLAKAQQLATSLTDRLADPRSALDGGGPFRDQGPEERYDNLQVAKEVADAAEGLGWDVEKTSDVTSDIVGGGGGFWSNVRRMTEQGLLGATPKGGGGLAGAGAAVGEKALEVVEDQAKRLLQSGKMTIDGPKGAAVVLKDTDPAIYNPPSTYAENLHYMQIKFDDLGQAGPGDGMSALVEVEWLDNCRIELRRNDAVARHLKSIWFKKAITAKSSGRPGQAVEEARTTLSIVAYGVDAKVAPPRAVAALSIDISVTPKTALGSPLVGTLLIPLDPFDEADFVIEDNPAGPPYFSVKKIPR